MTGRQEEKKVNLSFHEQDRRCVKRPRLNMTAHTRNYAD